MVQMQMTFEGFFLPILDFHIPVREGTARGFAFVRFQHLGELHKVLGERGSLMEKGVRVSLVVANWRATNSGGGRNSSRVAGSVGGYKRVNRKSLKEVVVSGSIQQHGEERRGIKIEQRSRLLMLRGCAKEVLRKQELQASRINAVLLPHDGVKQDMG